MIFDGTNKFNIGGQMKPFCKIIDQIMHIKKNLTWCIPCLSKRIMVLVFVVDVGVNSVTSN